MTASSIASTRFDMRTTSKDPRTSPNLAGRGSGSSRQTIKPTYSADSNALGIRNCPQIAKFREFAISPQSRRERSLGEPFDDHGHALAAADAHGLQTERLVVCLKVVQKRGRDAGARHAERMAQRDRAAGHIQLV